MTTSAVLAPLDTRVLAALIVVHARDGRATVTSVADQAGLSRSATHGRLVFLRDAGLATWQRRHAGTLRPTVRIIRNL